MAGNELQMKRTILFLQFHNEMYKENNKFYNKHFFCLRSFIIHFPFRNITYASLFAIRNCVMLKEIK